MLWIKNTAGEQDAMLTFALGGFIVITISILASMVTKITIGTVVITVVAPNTALVTAYLGATLMAYVNRRNNKDSADLEIEKMRLQKGTSDA